MDMKSPRLERPGTGLVIIDVQERLWPAMAAKDELLQNLVRLAKGAGVLEVPIWVTEQYRKGLGSTLPEISSALPGFAAFEKLTFSACGVAEFIPALRAKDISDVVLCGIEAHVCVCQTCLDLLAQGFRLFVVADATSSRTAENRQLALERMRAAGAVIVSVEMVLFELLTQAGTPEFRQIRDLVK